MVKELKKRIKDIERSQARLARQKQKLLDEEKRLKAQDAKLESLYKQSGFASPRELILALAKKYHVRISSRRPPSATPRRKRTKITAELRDEIIEEVKGGRSMNAVAKERQISYAVVVKICKGHYGAL